MPASTRTIRRRIKSVKNTKKITKAMELVAASKMRKAVNSVLGSRPYARLAWETVLAIGSATDTSLHPLLRTRKETRRVLLVVITSDRGLAGGFNSNMLKKTFAAVKELGAAEIDVITIGKRGADAMRRANRNVIATFTGVTNNPRFTEILPIGRLIVDEFSKEKYDKVILAYTDFISAIAQKPKVLELLPLGTPEQTRVVGNIREEAGQQEIQVAKAKEYTFEPSPGRVLDRILPRLVETMVYQAVLESAASEHSARMMAMRSASDAAADMIDSLSFTYNQIRQAGITKEIAEISSGKAALE